jgi:hypothetical protein
VLLLATQNSLEEVLMRSKLCFSVFAAVVALAPMATFAQQQMPAPTEGDTTTGTPPASPSSSALDLCGNSPVAAFGQTTPDGTPVVQDQNPKDVTGVRPVDLSSVTGMVVHSEGNLVLIRIPMIAATGNVNPAPATADKTLAVVRLPADCTQMPADGAQLTVTGMPTPEGILDAEMVQASE